LYLPPYILSHVQLYYMHVMYEDKWAGGLGMGIDIHGAVA